MWVTFHLFCFAVLHKNSEEVGSVVRCDLVLVPALIAIVPLLTYAYGPSSMAYATFMPTQVLHSLRGLPSGMVLQCLC